MTGTFSKTPDFVTTFNQKLQEKETSRIPRGPAGPKKGQKMTFFLVFLALAVFALLVGVKIYKVGTGASLCDASE